MRIILTCTTTANRLNIFYYGVQSLLNQSLVPDLFIVNLAEDEFEPMGKHVIPAWLKDTKIIVNLTEDTGSYKKLLPSLQFAAENDLIITADDDMIYHFNWLENLVKTSKESPNCVICTIARKMRKNIFNNWRNYGSWANINQEKTSLDVFPVGAGGILYKKKLLDLDFLCDPSFMKVAPGTDDLWFKMASLRKNTQVKVIPYNNFENMPILHKKGLEQTNFNKKELQGLNKILDYLQVVFKNYFGINITRNDKNWDSILDFQNNNLKV